MFPTSDSRNRPNDDNHADRNCRNRARRIHAWGPPPGRGGPGGLPARLGPGAGPVGGLPAEAAPRCVLALAEGAGPGGMVGGQMADLQAEGRPDVTLGALEAIHRRKTGALLRASLKMGAIVAGVDATVLRALDSYGHAVGLAFQIVDDLLDVQGDEAKLGKRVNKDHGLGKWTYPGLLGLEGSRRHAAA